MAADLPADELSRTLGDLAIELERQSDAESTLRAIVSGSVAVVPGVRWAGVSLIEGRQVTSHVPTHQIVADLDALQTLLDDGPCLSALRDGHTVQIDDMSTDDRWPKFTKAARERGVQSSLSFQLFVRDHNYGVLNLYASETHAFSDDSLLIGTVLAQHASVALAGADARTQFVQALGSRDLIGQAKGLLMQRNRVSGLHAFRMLVQASQETNTKLVDVARWIVETHESEIEDVHTARS